GGDALAGGIAFGHAVDGLCLEEGTTRGSAPAPGAAATPAPGLDRSTIVRAGYSFYAAVNIHHRAACPGRGAGHSVPALRGRHGCEQPGGSAARRRFTRTTAPARRPAPPRHGRAP